MTPKTATPEFLPYAFLIMLMVIAAMIWDTHTRWNRIAIPFRTRTKLSHHEDYDRKIIRIDGRTFKNLLVIPTEQGLYISHYGLLPMIMMPKRVLIPWNSLSDIYTKKSRTLGFDSTEYFVDTRNPEGKVQLKIPLNVAREASERGFIKIVDNLL